MSSTDNKEITLTEDLHGIPGFSIYFYSGRGVFELCYKGYYFANMSSVRTVSRSYLDKKEIYEEFCHSAMRLYYSGTRVSWRLPKNQNLTLQLLGQYCCEPTTANLLKFHESGGFEIMISGKNLYDTKNS